MKILIFGLSGSGKTTLANNLFKKLKTLYYTELFNADAIRTQYNDWDFSVDGRIRQANRINSLAINSKAYIVICDFIAPTQSIRDNFNADFVIWIDTIQKSNYLDTDKIFEPPDKYDLRITSHTFSNFVLKTLVKNINYKIEGY